MTKNWIRTVGAAIAVATMPLALTACGGGADGATAEAEAPALEPNLANPQVGDLWAAELTHFSEANFGGGSSSSGEMAQAYGLLKVVAVDANTVTVITEMGAWPAKEGAQRDLAGNQSDITWDESERITVQRDQFAQLVTDGKIIETRRPPAAQ